MGFLFMEIYRGDIPGPQDFKSCAWQGTYSHVEVALGAGDIAM